MKKVKPRGQADLKNARFGKLTALEPTDIRKNGYTVWRCRCDCGNVTLVPSRYLRNGWRTDCGCVVTKRYEDLTGQRFGKLVVDHVMPERKDGKVQWFCQCDCGGTVIPTTSQLKSGNQKSCGCLFRPPLKDWIGKRFDKLTVTAYDGKRGGLHYWKCLCDCGNETVVGQTNLLRGHTRSCGCLSDPRHSEYYVEGTCLKNIQNKHKLYKNNTSGVRGVYSIRHGVWGAQIGFKGKTKHLGRYDSIEEATEARREAEEVYDEILRKYGMEPTS